MKKCPFCAEKIQDEAIICRFCGKELPKTNLENSNGGNPNKKRIFIASGSVLFVILAAVVLFFLFRNKPIDQNTYLENYNDPTTLTGWDVKTNDPVVNVEAKDGGYHLSVDNGSVGSFMRDKDFKDTVLTVDLEFLSSESATAGIICRNFESGYGFSISNDGHWSLEKSGKLLGSGEFDSLQSGVNKIKVSCKGQQFSLEINHKLVGSISDPEFSHGQIGFSLSSSGKAEIVFDNLKVIGAYTQSEDPDVKEEPLPLAEIKPYSTFTQTPSPSPTLTPTPVPTIAFTPSPTPKGLYYFNDFESGNTAFADWIIHTNQFYYRHDHENENYAFTKNDQNIYSLDSKVVDPIYLIYDVKLPETDQVFSMNMDFIGTDKAKFGLICRYSKAGWYEMSINNLGQWQIGISQLGVNTSDVIHSTLAEGNSTAITDGSNNVKLSCIKDQITLIVNEEKVGSVVDDTIKGSIVGLVYQEDPINATSVEFNSLKISPTYEQLSDSEKLGYSSFYFHNWEFAGSVAVPENIQSLNEIEPTITIEKGRGLISMNRSMTWIALYPNELPENIEISVDMDVERTDPFEFYADQGFGLVCKWNDQPANRPGDTTGGYALWVLRSIVIVTPYFVNEFGNIQDIGPVEFSDDRHYIQLLEGTTHNLMARCWGDKVEFIIDGEQVASYKTSDFKGYGNNKNGSMVGLMFKSGDVGSPAWIDNLQISWGLPIKIQTPTSNP